MKPVINREGAAVTLNITHLDVKRASDRTDRINEILFGWQNTSGIFQDRSSFEFSGGDCVAAGISGFSATYLGKAYEFSLQEMGGNYWLRITTPDKKPVPDELVGKINAALLECCE